MKFFFRSQPSRDIRIGTQSRLRPESVLAPPPEVQLPPPQALIQAFYQISNMTVAKHFTFKKKIQLATLQRSGYCQWLLGRVHWEAVQVRCFLNDRPDLFSSWRPFRLAAHWSVIFESVEIASRKGIIWDICAAADVGTTHPFSPRTFLLFVSNRRLNFTPDVFQIL